MSAIPSKDSTRYELRFWAKVDKRGPDECWRWRASTCKGYGQAFSPSHRRPIGAHRIAWMMANGEQPSGMYVCHTCDNALCVNPRHLYLGTPRDNVRDMDSRGRRVTGVNPRYGADSHRAKLTTEQVQTMRFLRSNTLLSGGDISRLFGVSKAAAHEVLSRKSWPHTPDLVLGAPS